MHERIATLFILPIVAPDVLSYLVSPAPADTRIVPSDQGPPKSHDPDGTTKTVEVEDPIDAITGELVISHVDLEFPSFGVPFRLTRTYRSRIDFEGPFGPAWDHGYNQRLVVVEEVSIEGDPPPSSYPGLTPVRFNLPIISGYFTSYTCGSALALTTGHGTTFQFREIARTDTTIEYRSNATKLTLEGHIGSGDAITWTLRTTDGDVRHFDTAGHLVRWVDANDIGIALTWSGTATTARVDTITDSVGRVISFEHDAQNRIVRVAEPISELDAVYTYDSNGALETARRGDGRRERYEYDVDASRARGEWIPEEQLRPACEAACSVSDATCSTGGACDDAVHDAMGSCLNWVADTSGGCMDTCDGACLVECRGACKNECDTFCDDPTRDPDYAASCQSLFISSNVAYRCNSCADVCWDYAYGYRSSSVAAPAACQPFINEPTSAFENCVDNVYDCCRGDGDACGPGSCNTDDFEPCGEACQNLWKGWGDPLSQCPGVADLARNVTGCLPTARRECRGDPYSPIGGTCAQACATMPPDASTPSCQAGCAEQCPGLCTPAVCPLEEITATCETACTDECIEDGRELGGLSGPRYGHLADLNFNIVRVYDGGDQLYLTNTYGTDLASPNFDIVTHQQFGSYTADLFRRDLATGDPGVLFPPWVPTPVFEPVEICPFTCQADPTPWNDTFVVWGDLILVVPPGPVTAPITGFAVNRGPLSAAVSPTLVTFTDGPSGTVIGKITRRTSTKNYLATNAVSIPLTLDGGATVTLATSTNGNVTVTGSAAAKSQLLQMRTMTLFTIPGRYLRAYPGTPSEILVVSSGSCSQPFQLQTVSETEVMVSPSSACTGDLWVTPMAGPYPIESQSDDILDRGLGALSTSAFHPSVLAPTRAGGVWRRGIEGRWIREAAPTGAGIGDAERFGIAAYAETPMLSAPTPTGVTEPLFVFHHTQADFTVTTPLPPPSDTPWISFDPMITIDITCDPTLPGAARRGTGPTPTQSTTLRDFHGAVTGFYADEQNNLLRVINHSTGSTWSFNYDPKGQLTAIEAPDGARTCMTYDTRGNLTRRMRLASTLQSPIPAPIIEDFTYRATDSRLLSVTDPRTGTPMRAFEWDTAGNLQSITEADGTETTFALVGGTGPARAQIARAISPSTSEMRLAYNATLGTLDLVTVDATGALPLHDERTHDEAGRLVSHVEPRGLEHWFSFDGGFLAARGWRGDEHSGATMFDVNADGRIARATTGAQEIEYVYSVIGTYAQMTRSATDSSLPKTIQCFDIGPDDRVRETVSADGIRTRYTHDGLGNVTRVDVGDLGPSPGDWDDACRAHPVGGTESFTVATATYDTSGRLRTHTDARGLTTTITRDGHGRPIIERRPDDSQVWRGFDALGNVVWEAVYAPSSAPPGYRAPSWNDSGLRAAVEIAYDNRARVREIKRWHFGPSTAPVGDGYSIEIFGYDDATRTVTRTDDAGQIWTTRYDGAGRVISETAPEGATRTYDHRDDGRTIRVSEPGDGTTLAREVVLTAWGATASESVVRSGTSHTISTTAYDDFLRPVSTTSATGARVDIAYDAFSRVLRTDSIVPGANGENVRFTYDGDDRVVQRISDALGALPATWQWAYDALGREVIAADPTNRRTTTSYISGSSFPYQITDPRGVVITHAFSPLGQPAIVTADAQTDVQMTYSWDALGRLNVATRTDQGQSSISTTLVWDSLGGKIREEDNVLGATHQRTTTFDGRGLPTRTSVGATTWSRTFDALGRLDRIHVGAETNPIAQYTYAGFSIPRTRKVNNKIETRFAYDDLGRLVGQTDTKLSPDTVLASWDWEVPLDGVPRRAAITRSGITPHTTVFTADPIARLTAENETATPFTLASTTTYAQADSTASAALDATAWRYDLDGRAGWISRERGAATTTFTRDARDALTHVGTQALALDAVGAVTNDGATAIDYDALGLVYRVTTATADRTYRRDALGRVVTETSSNGVTEYAYDGPTRVLRRRPDGTIDITIDGARLDEHIAVLTGTARHFLFQDPVGSVYLTTDKQNAIKEWTSYTAYGEPTLRTPTGGIIPTSNIAAQYGFQGHPHDFALGLVDMRARMYRPTWGRFLSPDPLGLVDGTNRFAFVGSRPLTFIDPFGLYTTQDGIHSTTMSLPEVDYGGLGDPEKIREVAREATDAVSAGFGWGYKVLKNAADTINAEARGDVQVAPGSSGPIILGIVTGVPFARPTGGTIQWQPARSGAGKSEVRYQVGELMPNGQRAGAGPGAAAVDDPAFAAGDSAITTTSPTLPTELTVGRNAQPGVSVYQGEVLKKPEYAGITNDLARRGRQHGDRFVLMELTTTDKVLRGQARAIEEALIVRNPHFQNLRHEISPRHPWYQSAVDWGNDWLKKMGL